MVSQEQFEELRSKLAIYEAQQVLGQAKMQADVKETARGIRREAPIPVAPPEPPAAVPPLVAVPGAGRH